MVNKLPQEIPPAPKPPIRAAPPIYIRLPVPRARCPYTGMSRSGLADLSVPGKANGFRPPVRSIFLKRNKHAKRGIRLIDFASLMDFLKREFDAQNRQQPIK
jgi:hypothetical protein